MSLPRVSVTFAEGNLLKAIQNIDGFGGMVLTGSILASSPQVIFNLSDAEDLGITAAAEPYAYRQIREFYQELGGDQKLHIMLVPNTMSMANMLDTTEANGAIKLAGSVNREISLLAVGRDPAVAYDGGANFFDSDVDAALTASQNFGENRRQDLNFMGILVEGRVQNPASATMTDFKTIETDYGTPVVGGSASDGSASIGTALGRLVKYAAHIKAGKVANGPISLTTVYIGDEKPEDRSDVATIHALGCLSFMQHPQKAGYYFGIDRMANTGDYALIVRRRIVNKAAAIAVAVAVEEIEDEVDVDSDGKIESYEIGQVQGRIEQQIDNLMGDQISGREVYINPDQDIINTSNFAIEVKVQPKGYKSFINIEVGLTTTV